MAAVRYLVTDVDRAVDFYVRFLGFTLDQQMGAAFARVSRRDLTLWLSGVRFVPWRGTQTTSIGVKQQTSVAALRGVRRGSAHPTSLATWRSPSGS